MPPQREGLIKRKAGQPRAEFSSRLVAVQVRERADVGRATSLFRHVIAAEDAACDSVQPAVVPAHESLEGTGIAPASTLYEQQIRQVSKRLHRIYNALGLQPARCIRGMRNS